MLQSEKLRQEWHEATVKATEYGGQIQAKKQELAAVNAAIPQQPELMHEAARLTGELAIMHDVHRQLIANRDELRDKMSRVSAWEKSASGRRNLAARQTAIS